MENIITFPTLGLSFEINKVFNTFFGIDVYWYGLILAFSILITVFYSSLYVCRVFCIKFDNFFALILWVVPVSFIFSRFFYVAFEMKEKTFIDFISFWQPERSFIGAILGAFITAFIFCKFKKIRFGNMLDLASLSFIFMQIFLVFGDFINAETVGSITDLPIKMVVNNVDYGIHPIFLYEFVLNFICFILLSSRIKRKSFSGEIFFLHLIFYGFSISILDFFKIDTFKISILTVTSLIGILIIILSLLALIILKVLKNVDKLPYDFGLEIKIPELSQPLPKVTVSQKTTNIRQVQTISKNRIK